MIPEHQAVWNNCLRIIRDNVNEKSFKTWFEPIVPIKLENNVLTIQVPSPFFYEYLEEQYIDLLKKTLRRELGNDAKLEYHIVMDKDSVSESPLTLKLPGKTTSEVKNNPVNVPLSDEKPVINPFAIPGIKKLNIDPHLNPSYSFDNFVEGECNKLARTAGYAIATHSPGSTSFNPFLIYGGNGLGKTHLAQAIGLETKERFPDKTVLYVNANKFQTQYYDSIRTGNVNDFIHFYQMIDVLIIDDIHDLGGKMKTQDIFFHIFNHLHQNGKQIILTSDKAPVDLQGMEQRLLSRFKWGLSADLQTPDFETRVAILQKKIYNDGIQMPQEIIEYLASTIVTNIRELHGALTSIHAHTLLTKKQITLEFAKEIIERLTKHTKKEVSIDYIKKVVCSYYNIHPDTLQQNTRKREIVQARQIAMYFSKNLTKSSLNVIGMQIGGKDHATVLHAYRTVKNLIETDKSFRLQVEEIERKLRI
ncbi:MAG: chromosomal replication initiator protein DnaA [Bacteroidales bacterium]|nr:chromosomal replication initiator protein DnaA [Bacteroidales bacterium]